MVMTMATETSSYKSIFRGMSVFGGVQVFQILINLVRGKFVAILLGPAGSGMASLFTSASASIQQLASLGLPLALTREVAGNADDHDRLAATIKAGRRAVALTAVLGGLICLCGSWLLSDWTFGDTGHTGAMALMSAAVVFAMLWAGDQAILQGLRRVKLLSRATLTSAIVGLVAGVPLYWLLGTDGIVPAMVVLSVSVWIFYRIAVGRGVDSKLRQCGSPVDWTIVRRMVSFGLLLMAGQLIGAVVLYISNIFIRATGSLGDLGNFQAATSICTQYVGMIFAAMAMDYFPRLTAAMSDKNDDSWMEIVNRQTQLVVLVSAPLTILLMSTAPLVVRILLTESYSPAIPLLHWMGAAIFLQSVSYPMGYITFARGDRRLYFWLEGIFANVVYLLSTCLCYYWLGLIGLGMAAIARYAIDVAVYYMVNRKVYGFCYNRRTLVTVLENAMYVIMAFVITLTTGGFTCLVAGLTVCSIAATRTYCRLSRLFRSEQQ